MSNENTIERSAVGRIAKLGDLYDARSDSFCGLSIFNTAVPRSAVTVTDNNATKTDFIYEESFKEKTDKLNVTAEVKASILAGLVSVEGVAKYLQDQKTSAKSVRVTTICEIQTQVERLELFHKQLKDCISTDVLKYKGATHIVVGIYWGASACVTLEQMESDDHSEREIRGELALKFRNMYLEISGRASAEIVDKNKQLTKGVTFKTYADILPASTDEMPTDLMSACKHMQTLQGHLQEANEGKGKPVKYILFPLSDDLIKKKLASTKDAANKNPEAIDALDRRCVEIEEIAIMQFLQLFDDITAVKARINDRVDDITSYREWMVNEVVDAAHTLQTDLAVAEATLRAEFGENLKDIRSGNKEMNELDGVKQKYLKNEKSAWNIEKKFNEDFLDTYKKIDFAKTCRKYGIMFGNAIFPIDGYLSDYEEVIVLYAHDKLIKSNQQQWAQHRNAFINIAGKSRDVSASTEPSSSKKMLLIFLDHSFNEQKSTQLTEIHLKKFRFGRIISENVLKEQENDLSLNLARTGKMIIPSVTGKPIKKAPVKTICPGSLSGRCSYYKQTWKCHKCREDLQFAVIENEPTFCCHCGWAPAASFEYWCCDRINHKIEDYIQFDKENLSRMLDHLKSLEGEVRSSMEGKYFLIVSKDSNLALDVSDNHKEPGAKVIVCEKHGNDNQVWFEDSLTKTIRCKLNPDLCVTGKGDAYFTMQPFKQGDNDQQWRWNAEQHVIENLFDKRLFTIYKKKENKTGVYGEKYTAESSQLCLWERNFLLFNFFFIKSSLNEFVLTIEGGQNKPGTKVTTRRQANAEPNNQLWFEDQRGNIRSKLCDKLVLDTSDGTLRVSNFRQPEDNFTWVVHGSRIVNVAKKTVLAIKKGNETEGAEICPEPLQNDSKHQLWYFEHI